MSTPQAAEAAAFEWLLLKHLLFKKLEQLLLKQLKWLLLKRLDRMPNLPFELLLWIHVNIYVDRLLSDDPIGEQVYTDQKEEGAHLVRSDET